MKKNDAADPMPVAIMFDVDGCLISTGGAGMKSWRYAFDRLHGIPADIGRRTGISPSTEGLSRSRWRHIPKEREICTANTNSSRRVEYEPFTLESKK